MDEDLNPPAAYPQPDADPLVDVLEPATPSGRWAIIGGSLLIASLIAFFASEHRTQGSEAASRPEVAAASLASEANALWVDYWKAADLCDKAGDDVASTTAAGDVYAAYAAAVGARDACDAASSRIYALEPPASADKVLKDRFQSALTACDDAYTGKKQTYGRMAKILNGDERPSAMLALEQAKAQAGQQMATCVAMMTTTVETAIGHWPKKP